MKYFFIILISLAANATAHTQGKWIEDRIGGTGLEKVALLIPVVIGNKSCFMQLDTGAPKFLYWDAKDEDHSSNTKVEVNVMGAIRTVDIGPKVRNSVSSCGEHSIGTVGNQNFESGLLTINTQTAEIDFTKENNLLGHPGAKTMFYTPRGHPLVQVFHNGRLAYAMLDSGSASAELLVLSTESWNFFTHKAALVASASVLSYPSSAWGKIKHCYTSKTDKALTIGATYRSDFSFTYCPDLNFQYPLNITGIVGLAFFKNAVLKLDYANGLWLVE